MSKSEWGIKRICQNCGAKFYDMQRDPIVCPKCNTQHNPEMVLKSRRGRPVDDEEETLKKAKIAAEKAVVVEDDDLLGDDDLADDDTTVFIEDVSELGDDDADVGADIDHKKDD